MKRLSAELFHRTSTALTLVTISVLFLFVGCQKQPEFKQPPPPKVTVSKPERRMARNRLDLIGNSRAVDTVQLRARVEGYLEKAYFHDGQLVKKGDLLFLIQQDTYEANLRQAEGNVLNEKALLEHAKTEFQRYSGLYKQKAAAQTDVDQWLYERDSAEAGLMVAQAQRDLAKLNLSYAKVYAPFDGRVDRRLVDPGNLVGTAGSETVLAEFTRMNPLYVYFTVSEREMAPLVKSYNEISRSGRDKTDFPVFVGFANEEGFPHEARLDFTANNVDAATGTLLTRAIMDNPDTSVLPGQFARVRLPFGKEQSVLLLPQEAINYDQLGAFVLTVDDKNIVERKNVKTGFTVGTSYVIQEGLTGDEWVIVKGALKAAPGRKVSPEREGAPAGKQPPTGEQPPQNPPDQAKANQ